MASSHGSPSADSVGTFRTHWLVSEADCMVTLVPSQMRFITPSVGAASFCTVSNTLISSTESNVIFMMWDFSYAGQLRRSRPYYLQLLAVARLFLCNGQIQSHRGTKAVDPTD